MGSMGIRREDKNRWERRVPLTPEHVAERVRGDGLDIVVQPSEIRVFSDDDYRRAGATVADDLSGCPVVLAVKEIPVSFLRPHTAYVFFSHTMKGQKHNMDMLRRLVELKCTVVDYELVTDDEGRRLIFFGRHAGLAGMIDSLWALGQRLLARDGLDTPFASIRPAHAYSSLAEAKDAVRNAGEAIRRNGLPAPLAPFVCGFAGYGNVSQGAQEVFDQLPFTAVSPEELQSGFSGRIDAPRTCIKVVFEERHMVRPRNPAGSFVLQEYYDHPERYQGSFDPWLEHLTVLVNCIYWDERYPRLVTRSRLAELHTQARPPRLTVIGDVTCDMDGSVEATVKATGPDDPVYVYDPETTKITMGFSGPGIAVLAVDNLPCELSREASEHFSASLAPYMAALARADWSAGADQAGLPDPIRRAVILDRGEFAPRFKYMQKYLEKA